jgi:hypothetical protein
MYPPFFLARERASPKSRQAFLVRQGSLVFIEHFTTATDSSPYGIDPHSHVPKLYFRDFFNTLQPFERRSEMTVNRLWWEGFLSHIPICQRQHLAHDLFPGSLSQWLRSIGVNKVVSRSVD